VCELKLSEYGQLDAVAYLDESKNLRCSIARKNTRMFSIKCVGPCIWNNLPTDIRNISSIVLYKKTIRSCINEQNQITL